MKTESITSSRREFINTAHILAHSLSLKQDKTTVVAVMGGANIKKSLAVDAFLLAFEHSGGKFEVPISDRMMFEKHPSQANQELVKGDIKYKGSAISVAFTRNKWEQKIFKEADHGGSPSLLIIPTSSPFSSCLRDSDIIIFLDDMSEGADDFNHLWTVEILTHEVINKNTEKNFLRLSEAYEKRRLRRKALSV